MDLDVTNAASRRALPVAALVAAAWIGAWSGKHWLADHRIESEQLKLMKSAAGLEPGNAEAWDRVGRFEQYDFANADPAQAIADYLRAVRDDPHSAHYWMDLASAYEMTGDASRAREAYEQARSVYPASAEVAWSFGNFLLRQQRFSEGYAQIRQAVRGDRSLLQIAISRAWRSNQDVQQLLDHVLPADPDAYFQALDFFASIQQIDPALEVWSRLRALQYSFALPRSFAFIEGLIRADRSQDASRVWREALADAGAPSSEPANQSSIWNGDFAHDFANGGLDWRWPPPPISVSMGFETAPASPGGRALRLDFGGGSNVALSQPEQYVPVEPHRKYRFHAYLRTEHITTESGVRFSIYDPRHPDALNLLSDNLTGTNPWTAADLEVDTGSATHFLIVRVLRNPSRLFDSKLSGSAWIAGVSLTPAESPLGQTPR